MNLAPMLPKEAYARCEGCGARSYEYKHQVWKCSYCGNMIWVEPDWDRVRRARAPQFYATTNLCFTSDGGIWPGVSDPGYVR